MADRITKNIDIKVGDEQLKLLNIQFKELVKQLNTIKLVLKDLFPESYKKAVRDTNAYMKQYKKNVDDATESIRKLNTATKDNEKTTNGKRLLKGIETVSNVAFGGKGNFLSRSYETLKSSLTSGDSKGSFFTKLGFEVLEKGFNVFRESIKVLNVNFLDLSKGVKDVISQFTNLKTGIATFSSESLITNASARETRMKYGLSSSQAFAFTQATSLLNINESDLPWMNAEQRSRLLEYMERYSEFYNKMENSGTLSSIQSMQLEFEELKQELAMEFLSWVAENKDTIMAVLKGTFEVVKAIGNVVIAILNAFNNIGNLFTPSVGNSTRVYINNTNNTTGVLQGANEINDSINNQWSTIAKQLTTAIKY